MKTFYPHAHLAHHPPFEVFDGGLRVPYFESPERAVRILNALQATSWAEILPPEDFGLEPILAVHDPDYFTFLASAWTEWLADNPEAGAAPDQAGLMPATFPPAGWRHKPDSLLGRAGYYMMDLSAPIAAGTYDAALAAAQCALTAARSVMDGERAAFALCRPPGHHAGRANCGGYCYLNNAALAAHLASAAGKVAVLDIDYHAGNGTQDIFYRRRDVLTISIHADPNFEYPYFSGYAEERGAEAGFGYHYNFPLPAGTDDPHYFAALNHALDLIVKFEPGCLVVSAGMDIYESDPLGKIRVTSDGIAGIGRRIATLGLPTVIVLEGGYNNDALGRNVVNFLTPFQPA
jgi:acetoin utilization deacetylase AcuC-like enzyme